MTRVFAQRRASRTVTRERTPTRFLAGCSPQHKSPTISNFQSPWCERRSATAGSSYRYRPAANTATASPPAPSNAGSLNRASRRPTSDPFTMKLAAGAVLLALCLAASGCGGSDTPKVTTARERRQPRSADRRHPARRLAERRRQRRTPGGTRVSHQLSRRQLRPREARLRCATPRPHCAIASDAGGTRAARRREPPPACRRAARWTPSPPAKYAPPPPSTTATSRPTPSSRRSSARPAIAGSPPPSAADRAPWRSPLPHAHARARPGCSSR